MSVVREAFRQARLHSLQHMVACEKAWLRWGETSITEIVMAHAAVEVSVVPFTQRAEPLSGADWIWWWVDASGAYGMLVQAKRLTIEKKRWSFGFDYRSPGSARLQREVLFDTAASLDLLPVHALYLGTPDYRRWERCSDSHWKARCGHCLKRTVSLMPTMLASDLMVGDASSTYERSVALEDLWVSPTGAALLIPALERQMAPDLLEFLTTRQDGTLAVVRSMVDRVLRARAGMFSAASSPVGTSMDGGHDELGLIFNEVPDDTMHGGVNYFEHVLRPLRHAPPGYVAEIMASEANVQRMREDFPAGIAGVVVVNTPRVG